MTKEQMAELVDAGSQKPHRRRT